MGHCVLNPWTNNELKYSKAPAKKPKKIAVIGGGIGGMETAIQASLRGHRVDLYEKSGRLGGVFNAAAAMSFKEKDKQLLEYYARELGKSDVSVHMNTEIKDLDSLDADVIVVATGAAPRSLKIKGADRAVTAADFLNDGMECGDNVVIIGGGLTGCEIAYELALQGKHPSIVEMTEFLVGARGICMANSSMLRELLRFYKVPAYLNSMVDSITDEGVVISTPDGLETIPADTVIMSVGYTPDSTFSAHKEEDVPFGKKLLATAGGYVNGVQNVFLKKKDSEGPQVFFVGDCDKVGSLRTVIKQAYELVQDISY
jgi:2-enoate reductase